MLARHTRHIVRIAMLERKKDDDVYLDFANTTGKQTHIPPIYNFHETMRKDKRYQMSQKMQFLSFNKMPLNIITSHRYLKRCATLLFVQCARPPPLLRCGWSSRVRLLATSQNQANISMLRYIAL